MILAIDPGNVESAFVWMDEYDYRPICTDKATNDLVLQKLIDTPVYNAVVIEMVSHYGKDISVGKEVFDTCVWIGRFTQAVVMSGAPVYYVYRRDEKINLCGSMKANDSNIMRALIDRFAKHDFKSGKGKKTNPDWFYGFAKDIWAAYAVGVTYLDQKKLAEKGLEIKEV